MGREDAACLEVLTEERTVRVLLLPLGTVAVTLAMTWLAAQEADGRPPSLFISSAMNNVEFEPWSHWVARYFLWHLLLFSVVSFKRRALPHQGRWVADVTGILLLVHLWTGYAQGPAIVSARFLFRVHAATGVAAFAAGLLETVVVWWPEPTFALVYASVIVLFVGAYAVNRWGDTTLPDSGISFIQDRWDVLLQWALVAVHFVVAWHRFPRVEAEMLRGTWQPYLPDGLANVLFGRPPRQPAMYDVEGRSSGVLVLFEERTVRMLVVPLGTLVVSQAMTALAVREAGREEQTLFLSNGLNNYAFEPWPLWLARYYMWHVLVFSVASFKRRALPEAASWVSDFTAAALLVTLWSSYSQTGTIFPARLMFSVHVVAGASLHVFWVLETVVLWWPNRAFAAIYTLLLVVFVVMFALQQTTLVTFLDTGIPLIRNRSEIFIQWALVITHFVVVWYRFPRVETEMMNGIWKPYLPDALADLLFGRELKRPAKMLTYNAVPSRTGMPLGA